MSSVLDELADLIDVDMEPEPAPMAAAVRPAATKTETHDDDDDDDHHGGDDEAAAYEGDEDGEEEDAEGDEEEPFETEADAAQPPPHRRPTPRLEPRPTPPAFGVETAAWGGDEEPDDGDARTEVGRESRGGGVKLSGGPLEKRDGRSRKRTIHVHTSTHTHMHACRRQIDTDKHTAERLEKTKPSHHSTAAPHLAKSCIPAPHRMPTDPHLHTTQYHTKRQATHCATLPPRLAPTHAQRVR